ncbi:hypothetical protein [Thauera humireducens]|uniref:hypothetical protein n=1 Tax=Thauera humireducens TaxID=1134435 RepID=UPI003C7884BA
MTIIERSGERRRLTPSAIDLSASTSRPESVSSSTASLGSSSAICSTSLRFSPPEKPPLTRAVEEFLLHADRLHLGLHPREEVHRVVFGQAAVAACTASTAA